MTKPALQLVPAKGPNVRYVVGINIGSESCSGFVLKLDKGLAIKPFDFTNTSAGHDFLLLKLESLAVSPAEILIGLEATGRYWENLYYFFQKRGYCIVLLHPAQTHQFAQQRGLRAKTDKLDSTTITRVMSRCDANQCMFLTT